MMICRMILNGSIIYGLILYNDNIDSNFDNGTYDGCLIHTQMN